MNVQSTKYAIIEKVIQTNDEDLLSKVQAILEQEEEIILTDWQKEELDKRSLRHNSGESKNYTWEEVKKRAQSGI
jgi:putative addiction module component (TIGR02574 family)